MTVKGGNARAWLEYRETPRKTIGRKKEGNRRANRSGESEAEEAARNFQKCIIILGIFLFFFFCRRVDRPVVAAFYRGSRCKLCSNYTLIKPSILFTR